MTNQQRQYYLMKFFVALVPSFVRKKWPLLFQKKIAELKYIGTLEKLNIEGFSLLELMLSALIVGLLYILGIGLYFSYFKSTQDMAMDLHDKLQDTIDQGTGSNIVFLNDPASRRCFRFELDEMNNNNQLNIVPCEIANKASQSPLKKYLAKKVAENIAYYEDKKTGRCRIESGYGGTVAIFIPCDNLDNQSKNNEPPTKALTK